MEVQVSAGRRLWKAKVAAGGQEGWFFWPRGDGAFDVRGRIATGEIVEKSNVGYFTSGEMVTHTITIQRRGELRYGTSSWLSGER